jgi:hypothetical protein
VHLVGLLIYS